MATAEKTSEQAPGGETLKGRVALITGGTRGIGAAICHSVAGQGAAVAAAYSSNSEQAEKFLHELLEHGGEGSVHQSDVASNEDCERTVKEVMERHGRIDILVNNAGITADKPVLKMSDEDWAKVLGVNLSGAFYMSKATIGHMLERGSGRIVNISSIVGQIGNIGQTNYAASKSGMFGLTKSMAREVAAELQKNGKTDPDDIGITINAVAPGFIETGMTAAMPIARREAARRMNSLAQGGLPIDVAETVAWLANPASAGVTRNVVRVCGQSLIGA